MVCDCLHLCMRCSSASRRALSVDAGCMHVAAAANSCLACYVTVLLLLHCVGAFTVTGGNALHSAGIQTCTKPLQTFTSICVSNQTQCADPGICV